MDSKGEVIQAMKIITCILRKADCARSRLSHARTKTTLRPVSPLRIIGLLSALLFGIVCCFEMIHAHQLHTSQQFIICILELAISGWMVFEASGQQARQLKLPLVPLRTILWIQIGFIAMRPIEALSHTQLRDDLAINKGFSLSLTVIGIQLILFLCILNILINAFSLSERQRADQLENAKLELRSKLRASLMASGIAHEINQPLSTILLNIELTRKEISTTNTGSSPIELRLTQIESESQRVVSTIATMRSLLRNVQTDRTIFDLGDAISSAMSQQKNYLASKNICVKTIDLRHGIMLLGDAGQIQIAISNLLRNAGEALSAAGKVNPQIEIILTHNQKHVCVQVADNGPGFPEEIGQAAELRTTKPEGSGIGLYLANLAMENHCGSFVLGTSKKLGGAEATMRFPLA